MIGKPVDNIAGEIWKPIPHKDVPKLQFYASNFGRIKRQFINKKNEVKEYLIKPTVCSDGKFKTCLYLSHNSADRASTYLSTLIAMAFYGIHKLNIIHLDHNYSNCNVDNLQYVTKEQYYEHIGKSPYHPKLSMAKVIDPVSGDLRTAIYKVPLSTVRGILNDYEEGDFQQDIALKYNVSQAYVSFVLSGKRRNQHTDILPTKKSRQKRSGLLQDPDVMENQVQNHDKKGNP